MTLKTILKRGAMACVVLASLETIAGAVAAGEVPSAEALLEAAAAQRENLQSGRFQFDVHYKGLRGGEIVRYIHAIDEVEFQDDKAFVNRLELQEKLTLKDSDLSNQQHAEIFRRVLDDPAVREEYRATGEYTEEYVPVQACFDGARCLRLDTASWVDLSDLGLPPSHPVAITPAPGGPTGVRIINPRLVGVAHIHEDRFGQPWRDHFLPPGSEASVMEAPPAAEGTFVIRQVLPSRPGWERRIWIDTTRGFSIPRVERRYPYRRLQVYEEVVSELHDYGDGFWYPARVEKKQEITTDEGVTRSSTETIIVNAAEINVPVDPRFGPDRLGADGTPVVTEWFDERRGEFGTSRVEGILDQGEVRSLEGIIVRPPKDRWEGIIVRPRKDR